MRNLARIFIYALINGVLIGVNPAAGVAQEQPRHSDHAELVLNEEVVKKLLSGADPDVAFLARLKMMVGHLYAADFAVERGDLLEARQHITHPVSEILPDIVRVLKKRDLNDPRSALNGILETLQSGALEQTRTRIYDAVVEIESLQHSIDPSKMVMDRILADAAVLLLRTAVTEYDAAFKSGKIVNIPEYHDGSAFVTEAIALIQDAEYEWKTKNPPAYGQLELSSQELQTAWPSEIPPPNSVIPLARMLALVTTIELQINEIRNSD
jgi:hypothetical protein